MIWCVEDDASIRDIEVYALQSTGLEAKGFEDCIVSISDTGVDVVVNAASLSDVELAQIVDIVNRKTGVNESEIVISTVNAD